MENNQTATEEGTTVVMGESTAPTLSPRDAKAALAAVPSKVVLVPTGDAAPEEDEAENNHTLEEENTSLDKERSGEHIHNGNNDTDADSNSDDSSSDNVETEKEEDDEDDEDETEMPGTIETVEEAQQQPGESSEACASAAPDRSNDAEIKSREDTPTAEETAAGKASEATAATGAKMTVTATSMEATEEVVELHIDVEQEAHENGSAADSSAEISSTDADVDVNSDEEDDDDEHEPVDKSDRGSFGSLPSVPPTMTYPVNEMEVVTNRGGRSGSLSKFLDDADLYRRRSLTSYSDDATPFQQKKLTLSAFLDMAIDPILEVLDDADSDVRLWLLQPDTVEAVIKEFVKPPVFSGEPHEEYGYYKNYFICSEIIMKLYTGEEDLYESFSSDSSSGSTGVSAVFGCQDGDDLAKWELLYSIFDNEAPLDEMQLLFFSKALVRLHDGFCLEDGYVANVLRRFLPCVMPHLYSNTIKYMLTLILQSYESVHPITGRNDAMEIIVPLLSKATRLRVEDALNPAAVENASHLLVDMLQANQADRLGAFCRREGGVYLSKYFVRDQFGTIRGFESMTHGYHNFLQFMFLEELGKWPTIIEEIFENALFELQEIRSKKLHEVSGCLNVQVATELLLLFKKHGAETNAHSEDDHAAADTSPGPMQLYSDTYPASPRQSALDATMYSLSTLTRADTLWTTVFGIAKDTAQRFCGLLNGGLPSSVEIALAKHLHALVSLNNIELDHELHKGALMQRYLQALEQRPTFDMLLIHVVPAIAYIIKDVDGLRSRDNWLTLDLFDEVDGASSLPQLIVRADEDLPALKIYAGLLKDVIDEVLSSKSGSQNNITLQRMCKRCPPWGSPRYSRKSSGSPKQLQLDPVSSPQPVASPPACELAVGAEASPTSSSPESLSVPSGESSSPVTTAVVPPAVPAAATPPQQPTESPSKAPRKSSFSRRSSYRKSRGSEKNEVEDQAEAEGGRKSTHYIKQMLTTPVFRGSMRLGSVIKPPEKSPRDSDVDDSQSSHRGSFGWNSMLKRLRKSFVSVGSDKHEKKLLAIANEPYVPPTTAQAEVLVVDTLKGEDVSKLVHRDGGVHVHDMPPSKANSDKPANTITSGYMYKSKFPETGQRNVWERYFFVLNRLDGTLSYYVSESHAKDRTYLRGTARPVSVTEGIPVSASGQHAVYGFQINTQGHGAFMVVVDSIDTRLVWLSEIVTCVSLLAPQPPPKRLSLVSSEEAGVMANGTVRSWTKQQLKQIVVNYYKNMFGPNLKFSTPMEAPASFWMEEKIDPVAETCVLSSNLPDCVPFWGEFHGYKRLCDFWKIRDETIERSSGRVLRIVVDEEEETAVVMTSTTYRILRNSQTVTEESCDIVNMSGGAIISVHCTFDSFRIAEAFKKDGISAS